jgi:hypothetical protein
MWIGIVTFTPASQLILPGWELQPPEFIRGEAYPQSDIYGLGATLHHALTRRDPRLEPAFSWQERPIQQFNPAVTGTARQADHSIRRGDLHPPPPRQKRAFANLSVGESPSFTVGP